MVETERSEVLTGVAMGTRGGVVRRCSFTSAAGAESAVDGWISII